jgi:hypothetical protein
MVKALRLVSVRIHPRTGKISRIEKTNYWRIKMANGWTAERRLQQSIMIRNWKPWDRSTGPKTDDGRRRSSQNALAHGGYKSNLKEELKMLKNFLREAQKQLLKNSNA